MKENGVSRYSFIVPVFDRPEEIRELLESMCQLDGKIPFEVVIVEDGSTRDCKSLLESFEHCLEIAYYYKENSGPGSSRNFGMERATGDYFLILDSDCVLPPDYLEQVNTELQRKYVDCFGGPDRGRSDFSSVQQAVDFAMTSPLTTGGIRGGKKAATRFQPRSFNMGISQDAYRRTGGFSVIHPGEDPDLVLRLWKLGLDSRLFPKAWVWHKRRIGARAFLNQVYRFGLARPVLDSWHPTYARPVFWLPSLFLIGLMTAIILWLAWAVPWLLWVYAGYLGIVLILASWTKRSLRVGLLAVPAVLIQLGGYGLGFLKSSFLITFMKRSPESALPVLFRFNKR